MIVGGGDSAMEEAMFLSKFASKVAIVHRRDEFRASKIMLERAREIPNIEWITPYEVDEFRASARAAGSASPSCATPWTARRSELPIAGAFIAVGHEPQSQLVQGQVDVDENGYVITQGRSTLTNLPGVFAAGDLVDHTYRQAVTAAGSGCQAALDAEWYLRDNPAPFEAEAAPRTSPARPLRSSGRPLTGPVSTDSRGPGPSCATAPACPSPVRSPASRWPGRWRTRRPDGG